MIIAHNLMAMGAQRQFGINRKEKVKSTEKLASGYKVNRAADDAAGLSISEKMRNQIRNLNQAINNVEDGISVCKVADGALDEAHGIIHRIEELAVQAANDTNDRDDREALNDEVLELKKELRSMFSKTQFNGNKFFSVPYVPDIEGAPNDFTAFTTDSGEFGGILVNNIRYTWDEVTSLTGKSVFKNDGTFWGDRYTFTDYTGEEITFDTTAGHVPPDMNRIYTWEARDDGMYVNNVIARSWNIINPSGVWESNKTYSFPFHGMEIFFTTGADVISLDDVKDGINGQPFASYGTWRGEICGVTSVQGANASGLNDVIYIKDQFKRYVEDFKISASDAGIQLQSSSKYGSYAGYDLKRWGDGNRDFSDPSLKPSKTNNGFPIVDWGIQKDANPTAQTNITLDYDATYEYTDSITDYDFKFTLKDTTSLEQTKLGLSIDLTESIYAPVHATVVSSPDGKYTAEVDSFKMDYDLQCIATGKNIEEIDKEFNSKFSFIENADGSYTMQYKLNTDVVSGVSVSHATVSKTITDSDFRKQILEDGNGYLLTFDDDLNTNVVGPTKPRTISYSLTDKDGNEGLELSFSINRFYLTDNEKNNMNVIARQAISERKNYLYRNYPDADGKSCEEKYLHEKYEEEMAKERQVKLEQYKANNGGSEAGFVFTPSKTEAEWKNLADTKGKYNINSWWDEGGRNKEKPDGQTFYDDVLFYAVDKFEEEYSKKEEEFFRGQKNYLKNKLEINAYQSEKPYVTVNGSTVSNATQNSWYTPVVMIPEREMYVQSGANRGEDTLLHWKGLNVSAIGLSGANVQTNETAVSTLGMVKKALNHVSEQRSIWGAYQNRLEHIYDSNKNYYENLSNAESGIRDTDMATEVANNAKQSILEQVSQAMIAQSNQSHKAVLNLFNQ